MPQKFGLKSDFLASISILIGTCIGAGIFGLPYVISKVGLVVGFFYIAILGMIMTATCLAYGEVVLRTPGKHQFPQYAFIYLGSWAKKIAFTSMAIGFYGALIAYTMMVGNFLFLMLNPFLGGKLCIYQLIYFVFVAIALFLGLGMIKKLEKILIFVVLCLISLLIIFGLPNIKIENLTGFQWPYLFLPYGVILFAITGMSAVPDMKTILADKKKKLKKAIIIGNVIPIAIYLIVCLIIVGLSGTATTESAIVNLKDSLGNVAFFIGAIFGCLTMTTSFLSLGLVLKEVYQFDFHLSKNLSWALVVFPPIIIVLLNFLSFIEVLGMAGAIICGLDGILTMAIYKKARIKGERKPEYQFNISKLFFYFIYMIFFLGIVYEIYIVSNKIIVS